MLYELETECLSVILVPAPRPQFVGHMIRVAIGRNPAWYRSLAQRQPNTRRDRTKAALKRIRDGQARGTRTEADLLHIIRERVRAGDYFAPHWPKPRPMRRDDCPF